GRQGPRGVRGGRRRRGRLACQLQLARADGDRGPRRGGRARGCGAEGGGRQARAAPAGERPLPLRPDGAGEGAPRRGPRGRQRRGAGRAGGEQRRGRAQLRRRARGAAPARAGERAGALGGERGDALAAGRRPRAGARAGQGPGRAHQAHLAADHVVQRRGRSVAGQGARGGGLNMDFKDKVVFVTGGSRGIGRAIVQAFAARGARVVFSYAGNEAAAAETVELVKTAGGEATSLRFDVSDTAACSEAIDGIVESHGRLDVLVNNAGVSVDGLIMRFKDEDFDRVLGTNLKGAWALCRAVSRPM